MKLRPMHAADADAVLAVQQAAYPPSHHESWAVLGRKLTLWPAGCWVMADEAGAVLAYLFSHPGRLDAPPPLHGVLDALPAEANAYAVHDLALHPRAQGQGLGSALWRQAQACAQAAGLPAMSLVAVQGSTGFWARQGFEAVDVGVLPGLAEKLAGYGGEAVFMWRGIA